MKYRVCLLFVLAALNILLIDKAVAQEFNDVDNHVKSLSSGGNLSKEEMAKRVAKDTFTEREKARAIFVWIATNIAYDTDYKIYTSEEAFKRRKGVCQGYSELFREMCAFVGVDAITVSGSSKWYNYEVGDRLGDHAWNIVNLSNGGSIVLDATWGAGSVNGKTFTKKFNDYWFDSSPALFVFSHLPKEAQYQLLQNPIDMDTFKRLPGITPVLSSMGIDGEKLLAHFIADSKAWFPLIYGYASQSGINITAMPLTKELQKGNSYKFRFIAPANSSMALINNGQFEFINSDVEVEYAPKESGKLGVAIKREGDSSFNYVFLYEVK